MSTPEPRVGEQRPGGRAERVRSTVLAATSQLLAEVGYENLSIEGVAALAGVHKTTVYRRWPTKHVLVAEAVNTVGEEEIPIPDTGSLAADLKALLRAVVATNGSEFGTRRVRSLVAAAATSDELTVTMHNLWADRLAASATIVERAIERGELRPDTNATLIIETLIGPIWVRLLLTGEPIDASLADSVAQLVLNGALSRGD